MSPQPVKSPAKCGVTRGGDWLALHPCAPYIERAVLGRMIARPDHLTIRPNLARRWSKAQPILQIDDKTGSGVICPSGRLLTGVSSPLCKNISVPTPSLGGSFMHASGASRREGANVCLESRCRHSSCPGKSAKRVFALDDPGIHQSSQDHVRRRWIAGA